MMMHIKVPYRLTRRNVIRTKILEDLSVSLTGTTVAVQWYDRGPGCMESW